jgi:hypothetical protein
MKFKTWRSVLLQRPLHRFGPSKTSAAPSLMVLCSNPRARQPEMSGQPYLKSR